MNHRIIFIFLFVVLLSGSLHSVTVTESPSSHCEMSMKRRTRIEKWLNKSFNEAKKAVRDGRNYNGSTHKLPPCKIKEIEKTYPNLIFEYDCSCPDCGQGGPSHHIAKGRPVVRICDPNDMLLNNRRMDLNKPPARMCGCIQGLIVHELTHASGDSTEEGAVDCSRILYPCADDALGDATSDHSNCQCCN